MLSIVRTRARLQVCFVFIVASLVLGLSPRSVAADVAPDERYALGALNLATWLPPPPMPGSSAEATDIATFWSTRAAMHGPTTV